MAGSLIYNAEEPIYIGTHQYQIYDQPEPPESLHRVAEVYAISHEWMLIQSWQNNTASSQMSVFDFMYYCGPTHHRIDVSLSRFSQRVTTEINVTQGNNTANAVNLEAIFMDCGINTGHSAVDTTEASKARSQDITVQVGANSSTFLYRKRVKYRICVYFKLGDDDKNQLRTVGAWHLSTPLEASYEVYVNTRDCLTVSDPMSGTSILDIPHPDGPAPKPEIRLWGMCTNKCKEWLHGAGFLSSDKQFQNARGNNEMEKFS